MLKVCHGCFASPLGHCREQEISTNSFLTVLKLLLQQMKGSPVTQDRIVREFLCVEGKLTCTVWDKLASLYEKLPVGEEELLWTTTKQEIIETTL